MDSHWDLRLADASADFLKRIHAPKELLRRGGLLNANLLVHLRRRRIRAWARKAINGPRTVTVVLAVRNRGGIRLELCLDALRAQDYSRDLLRLVLVDYGSGQTEAEELASLAQRAGADLVRAEADRWSRSRANNIGIRQSDSLFTFYSDVDVLYSPSYIRTAVEMLCANPASVAYSQVWDLPADAEPDLPAAVAEGAEGLRRLRERATRRKSERYFALGNGGTFTRFLHDIRGMEESMVGWGSEDDDIARRLKAFGLRSLRVHSDDAFYLHQWHERFVEEGREEVLAQWQRNKETMDRLVTIRRNDSDWGRAGLGGPEPKFKNCSTH